MTAILWARKDKRDGDLDSMRFKNDVLIIYCPIVALL